MARKRSPGLTDGELRIMRVLWVLERGTVANILNGLEGARKPAYNTVLTLLTILERKGYVTHAKDGRAFTYRPRVGPAQARRTALSHVLNRFFDNSPELLVLNLIEQHQIDDGELERVRALLDRKSPARGKRRGDR
jgi:predicted transcriptional regulator